MNTPEAQTDQHEVLRRQIQQALEDPDIPSIHFNGFINSTGAGDVMLILQQNERPVVVLNASFTVIKTLAQKLLDQIQNLEQKTGNEIMTTDEVLRKLTG